MTGPVTLILGGARSGKSARAELLVRALPGPWAYVATAEAGDGEMAARIARHRQDRNKDREKDLAGHSGRDGGSAWVTIEEPLDLPQAFARAEAAGVNAVLVDCLTLWLSNQMLAQADIGAETDRLLSALQSQTRPVVLVSNEVGLGLVPETPLGRTFRDEQGRLNQRLAREAQRVEFVAAGLPLVLKG